MKPTNEPLFKFFESPFIIEKRWSWRHFKRIEVRGLWIFVLRNDEQGECCYKFYMEDKGWYAFEGDLGEEVKTLKEEAKEILADLKRSRA